MLSSAKIGRSSWRYYQRTVAGGACEYYTEHGDRPGRWYGSGLSALGLTPGAVVEERELEAMFGRALSPTTSSAGFAGALFDHTTSRTGDPQLHTHALVVNKVRCADGGWRALDGREIYHHKKSAGAIYQAALRAELAGRLSVTFGPVSEHGQAEITGVPVDLMAAWSTRTTAVMAAAVPTIADAEAALGRSLTPDERSRVIKTAVLATRPASFTFNIVSSGTSVSGTAKIVTPKGTFKSTQATSLTVNGHVAQFTVNGKWKGLSGYTLTVTATDATPDQVTLVVKKGTTTVFSVSGKLKSGTITVT